MVEQALVERMLPCPFCGSDPIVDNYGNGSCVRIYCKGPNCVPYPSVRKYANGDALERATAAWNTRTPIGDEVTEAMIEAGAREFYYECQSIIREVGGLPTPNWSSIKPDEPERQQLCRAIRASYTAMRAIAQEQ